MQVGPYRVLGRIGSGAQGAVFRAQAPGGREVAVKILIGRGSAELARFQREQRLLETLAREGGIVPFLDAGLVPEGPYVVMPFLGGGTLRDKLLFGPMPLETVLELARDLCAAVGRCHARGIVHRDLKPENVLFDAAKRPFVADLGLAKHFRTDVRGASQSQALSKTGELRGTAGYSAPEQFRDAKSVGPEADVFSLGAILYECLAGRPAFPGESAIEIMTRMEEGVRPAALEAKLAPRTVRHAIERALAYDVTQRPADAGAFLDALEGVEAPGGPGRSRGLAAGVAALGALGLAAALLVAKLPAGGPSASPTPEATSVPTTAPTGVPTRSPEPKAPAPDVEAALARGRASFRRGAFAQALDDANQVVEKAPQDARGHDLRGHVRLALLEYSAAARDLAVACRLDDKLASAWAGRAWALGARVATTSSESLTCAERALVLAPSSAETWIARSFARTVGDPPGAVVDARKAVALDASDAQTHCALANALGNAGDWKAARPEVEAALRLAPEDPHALLLRGIAANWLGDSDPGAVEADADRVLARAPRSHLALRVRGRYRGQRGDHPGAIADLRAAVSVEPDDPRGWRDLGYELMTTRPAEAETALGRAHDLSPEDTPVLYYRGLVRTSLGEFEAAVEDLETACRIEPEDTQNWYARGLAFLRWGKALESIPFFEKAVGLKPDSVEAWAHLGCARLQANQVEAARPAIEKAIGLMPNSARALLARALLRARDGDVPGSRSDAQRVVAALPPEDPDARAARALLADRKRGGSK